MPRFECYQWKPGDGSLCVEFHAFGYRVMRWWVRRPLIRLSDFWWWAKDARLN
jgi:hypothetical protein